MSLFRKYFANVRKWLPFLAQPLGRARRFWSFDFRLTVLLLFRSLGGTFLGLESKWMLHNAMTRKISNNLTLYYLPLEAPFPFLPSYLCQLSEWKTHYAFRFPLNPCPTKTKLISKMNEKKKTSLWVPSGRERIYSQNQEFPTSWVSSRVVSHCASASFPWSQTASVQWSEKNNKYWSFHS